MDNWIEIQPCGPLEAEIQPPGSKSITNRVLVCAAFANGTSVLTGALDSEDTRVMISSLRQLGIEIAIDQGGTRLRVKGCNGIPPTKQASLFVANSGTTMRFLTAMLGTIDGTFRIDGIERMRVRPIADLLESLVLLGASTHSENNDGCPPICINGGGMRGGTANIRGDISSQFLSGLLLAAPNSKAAIKLLVDGSLVSTPYIDMTIRVMEAFGVQIDQNQHDTFQITPQQYASTDFLIEPDASAASYFWAAAAIAGGAVTVRGLRRDALQGDVAFCDCLQRMGCRVENNQNGITVLSGTLRGIEVDMNNISDTVQTLAAVALFADGPTTITGVAHIRHKETDRITDLARELRKFGADVEENTDGLRITPQKLRPAEIETYNDHRMAMSLALVGLKIPKVVIQNPDCTQKTYPAFFDDLNSVCNTNRDS
ncbi:MAG: 3-phosphoshikimate 1-carboxyvinyltransferase [Pirellulaceae bacterium]|nr:3-phosphoshikimate 1-carboxyvinyltransferase [Pirellulaceae bacterium]